MNMNEIIAICDLVKMLAALGMFLTICIFCLWIWQGTEETGFKGGE